MAKGSQKIVIDFSQGVGMSTSADTHDGLFTPETDQVNLIAQPGVLHCPAAPVDKSTGLNGNLIASTPDPTGTYIRVAVSDTGRFYGIASSYALSLVLADTTRTYSTGKTHLSPYGNYVYGTSTEYVFEWRPSAGTVNQTYFTFPSSSGTINWVPSFVPHPVLTYENNIFYGNGPQLLRQTSLGGVPAEILLLDGSQTIVALGIDPGSGKMLISTATNLNISDTLPTLNKVHYYDGYSNKTLKSVVTDDMVLAFYPVGSTVYIGYGQNFGYWTGSGIQFIRHLNVTFDPDQLPYRQHFTNSNTTLYVVEKTQILAYGEILQASNKIFYYAYKNNLTSDKITHICYLGQNVLGVALQSSKFYSFDTYDVSTSGSSTPYTIKYEFEEDKWIRRIVAYYKNAVANNASPLDVYIFDQNGYVSTVGNSGQLSFQNKSGGTEYFHPISVDYKLNTMQLRLNLSLSAGLRKIIVFLDPANIT